LYTGISSRTLSRLDSVNKVRLLIVELGEDDVEDYAIFFWHSAIILAIACFARSWILSCWVKSPA